MLFEPKEHYAPMPYTERMPVWYRMQLAVEKTGFKNYLADLFHAADVMARIGDANDWRESEIIDIKGENFQDPTFTLLISQLSLKALHAGDPPYFDVQITFHYDVMGKHTMSIKGYEETYNGPVPKSFLDASPEVKQVQDGLLQAMMRPGVTQAD